MTQPRPAIPTMSELDLVIPTARLTIRPFVDGDVDPVFAIASQPEFSKHMSWRAHADKATTKEFITHSLAVAASNAGAVWAIEHDGKTVGCIGLDNLRWHLGSLRVDRAELGYWLAPALWNKGLMTEAASAVMRFAFEKIGLHKVTTRCFVDNAASRRVIEKVGFRFVGRAEEDVWRDSRWITQLLYEMTAPEWPDVHTTMRINRPRPT
jgi:ribosomal-protein-alanine N-acetyltransferase